MAHVLRKLFMSSQKRKHINNLLSQNAKQFKEIINQIKDQERTQKEKITDKYMEIIREKGGIYSPEADRITEEAQEQCDKITKEAEDKITEARRNFERRAERIWSLRQ